MKSKLKRAELITLPERTQVLSNNHYYQDKRAIDFGNGLAIIDQWLMTQRNDEQLKEIYGKCSFASNEWEYYTRVWVIDFEDHTFLIYSSGKGTSYEIVVDNNINYTVFSKNKKLGKLITRFIDDLVQKMRNLDSNQDNIIQWQKLEIEQQKKLKQSIKNKFWLFIKKMI